MQIIYEIKHKDRGYDFENDPDKEFMTECAKVDDNPPETWKKYSNMTGTLSYSYSLFENVAIYEMNKQDILEVISTNIDTVMNENVTIENLKGELVKRIFTNSLSLQNIVDCSVISICIYLKGEKLNGKNITNRTG